MSGWTSGRLPESSESDGIPPTACLPMESSKGPAGRPKRVRRSELDDYIRRNRVTGGQLRHLYEWPPPPA